MDDGLDEALCDLSHEAFRLYVAAITYNRRRQLGGCMTAADVTHLCRAQGVRSSAVAELVRTERWTVDGGITSIRRYEQFNPLTATERVRRFRHDHAALGLTAAKLAALRLEVFERDGWTCRYCGAAPERKQVVIDHVIPTPDGPTTLDNLVASCRSCNTRKKSRTPDEAGMSLRVGGEHARLIGERAGEHVGLGSPPSRARPPAGYPIPEPVPEPKPKPTTRSSERVSAHGSLFDPLASAFTDDPVVQSFAAAREMAGVTPQPSAMAMLDAAAREQRALGIPDDVLIEAAAQLGANLRAVPSKLAVEVERVQASRLVPAEPDWKRWQRERAGAA